MSEIPLNKGKTSFIYSFSFSFILCIFFALIYAAIFYYMRKSILVGMPVDTNRTALDYFYKFGALAGIIFALISLIKISVLYLIAKLFKIVKYRLVKVMIYLLNFKTCFLFGYYILYLEPRNTSLAIAIIEFFGRPLFYSSIIMVILLGIWFWIIIFKYLFTKKNNA